jgi:hypothetical protein
LKRNDACRFRARSSLCLCRRLPRSSATVFGRWLHLATFSKGETRPLSEARVHQMAHIQNLFCTNCLISRSDLGLVRTNVYFPAPRRGHRERAARAL